MSEDKKSKKPLEILYGSLKRDNYDVPDSYESFERTLTASGAEGVSNRQALYDALRRDNYDVPDTYESFSRTLFAPVGSSSSELSSGAVAEDGKGVGKGAVKRGSVDVSGLMGVIGDVGRSLRRGRRSWDNRMENIRKGNTLGKTSEVKFNPESGKMERRYYTTHGDEVTTPLEQSRLNLKYRDEWEATTPEGRKHREKRIENDFERRVGASLDKYDPDNAAAMVWQKAEDKSNEEFGRYLDERSKPSWSNFLRGAAEGTSVTGGLGADNVDTGIKAFATHLKYHDLQRMADDAWNMLGKEKQQSIIEDMYGALKNRYPQATEQQLQQAATEMAREQSDRRMYELAVAKNVPKDAAEYFIRKVAAGNAMGTLMQTAARTQAGTTGDWVAREDAEQRFEKQGHKVARIAGTVTGFALDPLLWASAGAGGAAVKGAAWLGGKRLGEAAMRKFGTTLGGRMLGGAIGGAVNFGTYEAGSEALDQMKWGGYIDEETGERKDGFSFGNVAGRAGHGLMMGAVTGVIAPYLGNVSDKLARATESTVGKIGIRAGELGVGTVAEGTIFAVPEIIDTYGKYGDLINSLSDEASPNYIADEQERAAKIEELRNSRGDALMDVWTDNMAMIAGFKAQHLLKSAPRVIYDLARSKNGKAGFETRLRSILDGRGDLALTEDEKKELEGRGYGDLKDLTEEYSRYAEAKEEYDKARPTTTDASRMIEGGDGQAELPYNRFVELMTDNSVSEAARAKMYYYLTGHGLPMSTVMGSSVHEYKDADGNVTGYTVQSFGANGVITSRTFGDKKRADVEVNRINRQAELNGVDVGERYFDSKQDDMRMKQACKNVAKEVAGDEWRVGGNATLWERFYYLMKTKPEEMNEVERAWAKKILDAYDQLGDKFEYENYTHESNGSILGVETETVYSGSRAIREDINNEFGVDVDKVIRKEPNRRSEQEQKAFGEYINRLYADVRRKQEEATERGEAPTDPNTPPTSGQIEALLGANDSDPTNGMPETFRRGYNADAQERHDIAMELASDDPNNASYAERQEAWNGVVQRINEDAAYMVAQQREQTKQMQHTDGSLRPAILKEKDSEGNDQQVYIVDGNVQMMPDGSMVDKASSDNIVVVYNPATGERKQIDPSADTGISSLGEVTTAEQREADIERSRQEYVQAQIDEAQGTVRLAPGQQIVLPTGEEAVVVATDADGENLTVALGDGTQATVQRSELQRIRDEKAAADYRQRHGITEGPAAQQPEASQPQEGGRVAGAPADYTADMELTIRDEDGSEKPAMVMGRVRYENGSFVPDANGNIIEYFMDGEVKHDHEDKLASKVVSHVAPQQPEAAPVQEASAETPAPAEPTNAEQPTEVAPQPVQEPVQTVEHQPAQPAEAPAQPTEQPTAEPIPVGEDGEEDWQATTPERAHAYIFNEAGLSRSEGNEFIAAQTQAAQSALVKAKSAQMPRVGTSIKKYNEAKAKRQEKIDEAQRVLDYWNGVREIQNAIQREENERRAAEDAVRHDEAVAEAQAEYEARKQAEAERKAVGNENPMPAITEKWNNATKVDGHRDEIMLPDGTPLKGHYVLHESGASSPSHNPETWQKTDGFPMDANDNSVNDRDYERDHDAQEHTQSIARQYDQRALQSVPVVSNDGVVLSGNGRTMAGELAARDNTDGAYVSYLKEYAPKFGFTAEQVEAMQHPRVSFVPDEAMPYTAETFAKFNQQEMKSQNKTEQAVKLGKTVSDDSFKGIVRTINGYDTLGDFYNDAEASLGAVYDLHNAGVVPQAQLAEMVDGIRGQEKLSAVGREFLENMLIGKAFESDTEVVRMLTAEPAMRQTVITALGEIVDNIALGGDWSLQGELADAVKLCFDARQGGAKYGEIVSTYARQGVLFADPDELQTVADFNNATMLMLADALNDKRVTLLKTTLQLYNNNARQSAVGQADLFAGGIQSREDILRDVITFINENYGKRKEIEEAMAAAVERRKAESVQQDGIDGESRTRNEEANTEVPSNDGRGSDGSIEQRQSDTTSSEEVDENGIPFVKAADGTTVFGEIREDSGLQPAPIRLSEGSQDADGKGYGLAHIEANHGEQIRNAGFASVEDFVAFVAKNYDEDNIRVGKRRDNGNTTYLIQVQDEHDNTLFIELSRDGSYWNVNSAGIFRKGYSNKKETVAKTEPQQPNNAVSTGSSLSADEVSGITSTEPNGEPTVSAGKGSDNSAAVQEKTEKVAENQTPNAVQTTLAAAEQETNIEPTAAQKEAGNYKKGHVKIDGYDVTIENPKGSVRRGTDASGKQWEQEMQNTYGYIRGTEGVDGDHIDVFFSEDPSHGDVFVVDQVNKDGSFDEHKVMYGFPDIESARKAYLSNYEDGWKGLGAITPVSKEEFKKWIRSSHRKTKPFAEYSSVKTLGDVQLGEHPNKPTVKAGEDYVSASERIARENEVKRTAEHFPMETVEEAMAFDKRVPEMDDAELLAYMQEDGKGDVNKAHHPSVYDEYDYRHGDEQLQSYDDTLVRLNESGTTLEQAEEMLANIQKDMSRLATDERAMLLGQEDALLDYIAGLEKEGEREVAMASQQTVQQELQSKTGLSEKELSRLSELKSMGRSNLSKRELDEMLLLERKERILREGSGLDTPFGLKPVSEISSADDIDANIGKIVEGLKRHEGDGTLDNFEGFAYQGAYKKNAGHQVDGYLKALTGVVPGDIMESWADGHGVKTHNDVLAYGERLYDEAKGDVSEPQPVGKGLFSYFNGTIKELISEAKKKGNALVKKIISPVSSRLQEDLSAQGLEVDGYNHVLDNSAIRHTLKQHGGEDEVKRGQIPITEEDFDRLPDVVENYDDVRVENGKRDNIDNIIYSKSYPDGTTIYVEEKRDKRKELAALTMWKTKNTTLTDANRDATPISDLSGVVSADKGADLFGNEQGKGRKSSSETKIEDVGEVLAGARKDMRREIAKSLANVTEAALVEKPFGKVYKKLDLKKAVESGALREKDAIFYEALFSTVNQQKPKVTQREMRSKRYIPDFKTKAERWAADTFKQMEVLRQFMELDEPGRDAMMERMLADRYPTRDQELAEIEKRKGWNPDYEGHKYEWGDMTTPNPLWVTHEVMNRLGYSVGDKLDVPYGVVKANMSGTGYSIENLKGERASLFGSGMTLDEAIDRIVYLAKLKRGDADVSHPTQLFAFPASKSESGESGRYRVMWGRDYKTREFDSKEEADAFAQTKSGAYVSPIMETKRRFGYKVRFTHPLTGEKMFVDDTEFDTKEEAQAYFDGNFEKLNEATNAKLQEEREKKGEKKTLTANDVVHVTMVHSAKGGWTHAVVIDKKYANNDGMPYIIKEGFASRKDAKSFADSVKDDVLKTVLKHKEDAKKIVYFDTGEDSRIGEDYRNGKNVDAEDFMNTFGFRGVQFGNWTNQADRQMAVNQAYDAFMDMARLIGVSPKAMSLNGELGIAFGARGVGGFAAHYEPGEVVINLTKTQGAGSLAHEWWHALDNYFARRAGSAGDMVTDNRRIEMRDALRKAFNDMLDMVKGSDYAQRSAAKGEYWGRTHEITARLLAEWVDRELKKRGELNTFLSRGAVVERGQQHNYDVYEVLERLAGREPMPFEDYRELPESLKGIPYPSAKEVEQFGGSLRHIFDTLEEKVDEETGNVMLYEPTATYETRDGGKVVCRSLFDEMGVRSSDEVAMVSQHTQQGQGQNQVIAPSEIRLRKLKKGETCHVERVYEETKQFDFTGKEKVESAEDVAYIFRQLENAAVENSFLVLVKDGKPTVIHLGVGSYVGVMAPYEQALVAYRELKPEQVYFVHNHPSGVLKASRQDQDLLNRIKRAFGEDVVQQGIIIDTTSGNYGEFESIETADETYSVEEEMPKSQGNDVPIKVYQFSRQVFAPDWNPESAFKIIRSQSVAEFVSSHRLGKHKKMSFLVVNNSNSVVANVFLPWTKLSDIRRSKDAGDLLAGYVHQCGGVRGVLYGNYDYEPDDRAVLAAVGDRMRQLNAPLMDALHVEHSAYESGWAGVGEPRESYGVDARDVAQSMDDNNGTEVVRFIDFLRRGRLEQGESRYFHVGETGDILNEYGISGKITIGTSAVNSHHKEDADHLDENDWVEVIEKINEPVAITEYGDRGNSYRIYTIVEKNGKNICVGVDVNSVGRDVNITNIRTAFARDIANALNERLVYPHSRTELETAIRELSLRHNREVYPEQPYDAANIRNNSEIAKEDRDMMRTTAEQMGAKLNTRMNIIEDVNDITHPNKEIEARRRRSKGWYDTATGQVNIVLDNNKNIDDVKASVGHETIAHKGLRELVGEERYDEFLEETYQHLRDDLKKGVDDAAGRAFIDDTTKNGKRAKSYEQHRRTAVDELFGRLAEKPFEEFSEGERTLWQKIKATVRRLLDKFLGSLKLPKWFELGDNELRYMLWRSKERLERGKEHPIDLARDIVKREELGLTDEARYNMGDVAEPSFAARRDRAVKEHGYVHPGLNSAEVKVVSIKEKSPFDTSKKTKALKEDVVAYANEHNIIGTMTEEETKGKGKVTISKASIEKMVDDSATGKSVDKDTHLAIIPQLREVIAESIMAETHPDYNKGKDGKRSPENGHSGNVLIHRCYGAINIDGMDYRVKITLKEDGSHKGAPHKAYTYEVTKIELLGSTDGEGVPSTSYTSNSESIPTRLQTSDDAQAVQREVYLSTAMLLQNVEKSHDLGKKLLEQSEIADESTDLYRDPDETEDISSDDAISPSPQQNSRDRGSAFGLDDIWNDQSLGLQERITAAATRLANNHRDDKTLRNDAMRAIGGNLSDLRKAMSLQRTFDMTTVKRVADLARVLMNNGYLNGLTQQEVKRLLAAYGVECYLRGSTTFLVDAVSAV